MEHVRLGSILLAGAAALALTTTACAETPAKPVATASKSKAAAKKPANGAVAGGPGSLAGEWYNSDYQRGRVYDVNEQVVLTIDHKRPPMQPWADALYNQRLADSAAGKPFPTPLSQCMPSGVPAMFFYPQNSIQFLETPGQVTMLNQQFTYFRIIPLNAKHKTDPDPTYMGDSVGRWEGDTLVVDTIGLNDKTVLDQPGMPHSENLHVIERWRRTGKDVVELVVTIDDPKVFTRPWDTKMHFRADNRPMDEYFCENNRNLSSGGAIGTQMPRSNQ